MIIHHIKTQQLLGLAGIFSNKGKPEMTKPKWLIELLQTAPDASEFQDFETTIAELLSDNVK
jgi:hypothetical protein